MPFTDLGEAALGPMAVASDLPGADVRVELVSTVDPMPPWARPRGARWYPREPAGVVSSSGQLRDDQAQLTRRASSFDHVCVSPQTPHVEDSFAASIVRQHSSSTSMPMEAHRPLFGHRICTCDIVPRTAPLPVSRELHPRAGRPLETPLRATPPHLFSAERPQSVTSSRRAARS